MGSSIKGSRRIHFSVMHQRSDQLCISMLVVMDVGIAHINNNFGCPPAKYLREIRAPTLDSNWSRGSTSVVNVSEQRAQQLVGTRTLEIGLGDFACDYTLGCSFLSSTPTPRVASTDMSVVRWWMRSGCRYNQKSLFLAGWIPRSRPSAGTKPGQCQAGAAAGAGGQGSAVAGEMRFPVVQAETFCCQTQKEWRWCRSLDMPVSNVASSSCSPQSWSRSEACLSSDKHLQRASIYYFYKRSCCHSFFQKKLPCSGGRHDDGTCLTQWFKTQGAGRIDPFSI